MECEECPLKYIGQTGCKFKEPVLIVDNLLPVGGEVVSLKRQPPFSPRKNPGTHFCQRLSRPQDNSAAGRIRSIENIQ
jgi:hypothetical protein